MSGLGSQSTVGVESVEWLEAGGGDLTVQVTGRWRRRRGWFGAETRAPAVLFIEAAGTRHRFPAMPEPPSLAGAAPGTWRLTFTVPHELVPELAGHTWLTLGTVTVPLPGPDPAGAGTAGEPDAPPAAADPGLPGPVPGDHPASTGPAAGGGVPAADPSASGAPSPESAAVPSEPGEASSEPGGAGSESGSLEIERAWQRAEAAERTTAALGERATELERALARGARGAGELAAGPRRRPGARPRP